MRMLRTALLALAATLAAGCASDPNAQEKPRPVGGPSQGVAPPEDTEHVIMNPREVKDVGKRTVDLLAYFSSNDPRDWERARRELRMIGKPFVPDYLEALMKVTEGQDPNKAALARVELARRGKIARILSKLQSNKYDDWKTARFEMQRMGGDAPDYLISALILEFRSVKTNRYEWARKELVELGERTVPLLREFLVAKGSDNVLRDQCAITLCHLAPKGHAALLEAAKDPNRWTRVAVAKGIGVAGAKTLAPTLRDQLLGDESWEARAEAALSYGKLKDPSGVPPLMQGMKDPDSLVRRESARALGEIGAPEAVPALIEVLEKEPQSRHSDVALVALHKISGQKYPADPAQWRAWWARR